MEIWLTKGIGGKKVELLKEASNVKQVIEAIWMWKQDDANKTRYKIESYDRFLFDDKANEILVDFGDYTWFFAITECGKSEFEQILK